MKKFTKQISSLLAAMAVGASGNPGLQIQTAEAVEVTNDNTTVIRMKSIESTNLYEYYEETTTTTAPVMPSVVGTYYDRGTTEPTTQTTIDLRDLRECVACGELVRSINGVSVGFDESVHEFYCDDCYKIHFVTEPGEVLPEFECYLCGKSVPRKDGLSHKGEFYCDDCADYVLVKPTIGTAAPSKPVTTITTTTTPVTSKPVTTTTVVLSTPTDDNIIAIHGSGDTDLDGLTTLTDLTEMSLYLLGDKSFTEDSLYAMDITKDGKIDVADLASLKMMVTKVRL